MWSWKEPYENELSDDQKLYMTKCEQLADQAFRLTMPASEYKTWQPGMILSKHFEWTKRLIQNQWDENKFEASSLGTHMHYCCELVMNGLCDRNEVVSNTSNEFKFFHTFMKDQQLQGWVPYRAEQIVWDQEINLAGSVDAQFQRADDVSHQASHQRRKTIRLIDWKRSKEIKLSNFQNQKMTTPFEEFDDCNLYHYYCQLNLYKFLLEKHYQVDVQDMYILVFHSNNETYLQYKVPEFQDKIKQVVDMRKKLFGIEKIEKTNG